MADIPVTKKPLRRGKPFNVYFRDADLAKIRELTAYAATQGERTSDTLMVRACLRAMTPGRTFLNALREAASDDLRFRSE